MAFSFAFFSSHHPLSQEYFLFDLGESPTKQPLKKEDLEDFGILLLGPLMARHPSGSARAAATMLSQRRSGRILSIHKASRSNFFTDRKRELHAEQKIRSPGFFLLPLAHATEKEEHHFRLLSLPSIALEGFIC